MSETRYTGRMEDTGGMEAEPAGVAAGVASENAAVSGAVESAQAEPHEAAEERVFQLDPETEARRRAALAEIRTFGDPVLRSRASEVTAFDDALRRELDRMGHLMEDALGVGLAATQVGLLHRVFVYRVSPDAPFTAVVNPVIEWVSEELETAEEGCLSLPGVAVDVERPLHVRVRARDQHGAEITIEASGLDARVIQHETDHLDGVLILDRTSREERKEALRILRERARGGEAIGASAPAG